MTAKAFREKSSWWFLKSAIDAELARKFWKEEGAEFRDTLRVLLAIGMVGACAERIRKFTKLSRSFVRSRIKVLHENKIIRGHKLYCNWFGDEYGQLELLCDGLVAEGLLSKTWEEA